MNDTIKPKRRKPIGTILALLICVFILTPMGSEWMRTSFLFFKNGNMVGTQAPEHADGIQVAAAQASPVSDEGDGERWTLYTFFSPT